MPFGSDDRGGMTEPMFSQPDYESQFKEILPAAFRQENSIGSAIRSMMSSQTGATYAPDPNFDGLNSMPDEYALDHADKFARLRNSYEMDELISRIEGERRDRQIIADGGMARFGAIALVTLGDPTAVLMPGAIAVRGVTKSVGALRLAGEMGVAGGASAILQEAALQSTQYERTASESIINIAAATFLSAAFGAGITGAKSVITKRMANELGSDVLQRIAHDLSNTERTTAAGGGSGGSAMVRDLGVEDRALIQSKIDDLVANGVLDADKADTEMAVMVVNELLKRDGMKKNWAINAALKALGNISPELRMLNSPSHVARELLPELAEPTVVLARNQRNAATPLSAEAMVKDWEGNKYRALKFQDDQYTRYAEGRAKRFGDIAIRRAKGIVHLGDDKISDANFNEAVARAMIRGDDAATITGIPAEAIPFINATAANWRKEIIQPMTDIAIAQGRLPEGVTPKTAASYFMRMYDIDKLTKSQSHIDNFLNVTTDWLEKRKAEALVRSAGYDAENAAMKEGMGALRQQISAIEDAVKRGTSGATKEETTDATNAALKELEDKIILEMTDPKVAADAIPGKANEAAIRSFFKTLRKDLAEEIHSSVAIAVEREASKALNELLDQSDDIAANELMPIIRDELTQVGVGTASKAAGDALPTAIQKSIEEAALAAEKTVAESIAKQEKNIAKMLADPDTAMKEAKAAIAKKISQVASSEAGKAARAATKDLRKELVDKMKEQAKRKKLHVRDSREITMERQELFGIAQEILGRIVSNPHGRLPYDMGTPTVVNSGKSKVASASPLKERAFGIEDTLIEDFLILDTENVMNSYVRQMAPDLALHEKGLSGSGFDSAVRRIEQNYVELKDAAKNNKEVAKLEKHRKHDISDLITLRDRLMHTHGLGEDPSSWGAKAGRNVLKYNYVTKLGGMTASALPDPARNIMVHGILRTVGDGLIPLLSNFSSFGKLTQELRDMGIATDMMTNVRMNAISDTIANDFSRGNWLERMLDKTSNHFGMITLMAPWNTAMKQFSGVIGMARLVKAIRDDVAGSISAKDREWLRSSMIGADDAKRIMRQLDTHSIDNNGLNLPNVLEWDDKSSARLFRASIRRQVDQVIVTPGIGDIPTMATATMAGRMVFQFKSFALSSTSRVLMSGLQQSDAAILNGVILSVALGAMASAFKMWDAGKGDELANWTPSKWITEGVDRSGVTGIISDVNNMLEKVTRGSVGLGRLTGGEQASRYASRDVAGALFGPTIGTVSSIAGVIGNASLAAFGSDTWHEGDGNRLVRTAPFNNVLFARQLFKEAGDGIDRVMGAQ